MIPAAGLGTRLLSATKEQPKEMLPIFTGGADGTLCLKPMLQQIFEQLFDSGMRYFYFIVGREKRAIEDHFTPDRDLIERLNRQNRSSQVRYLQGFYHRIEASTIVWVNQPAPKGFGDAVLRTERLLDEESFMVHAGDTCIVSATHSFHQRLTRTHKASDAEATLSITNVKDPRSYGVVYVGRREGENYYVKAVVEKPEQPTTRLAIMPVYVFKQSIFDALRVTPVGKGGEIQLTDAIQELIDRGHRIRAVKLRADEIPLDIGTPEKYWETLRVTHLRSVQSTMHSRAALGKGGE